MVLYTCPDWVKILDYGGALYMPRVGEDAGLWWCLICAQAG